MLTGNQNPPLKIPTEEDAFHFIVRALRDTTARLCHYGYEVYMPRVFDLYLEKVCGVPGFDNQVAYKQIAPAFYAAAWELCRRGVLRPGVMDWRGQETEYVNGYTVTPAGKKWLAEAGQYDYVPIEPGRFSKLLDSFSARFGAGFQERSQEAIRCYGTNAYLGLLRYVRGGSGVDPLGRGDCQGRRPGQDREDVLGKWRAGADREADLGFPARRRSK